MQSLELDNAEYVFAAPILAVILVCYVVGQWSVRDYTSLGSIPASLLAAPVVASLGSVFWVILCKR